MSEPRIDIKSPYELLKADGFFESKLRAMNRNKKFYQILSGTTG